MGKSTRSSESEERGRGDGAAGASGPGDAAISFEAALEQLESTVNRLEEGEMPLEEALELFESGVKLSRQCSTRLDDAERRVEILVANREGADGVASVEFESDEDWDDDSDDEEIED
jgi:exodeoxyribonuclease VII small subunit